MEILTGRYRSPVSLLQPERRTIIGITLGAPRFRLPYPLAGNLKMLAPHYSYFRSEYDVYRPRYRSQLDRLGVPRILQALNELSGGEDVVLLCYENLATDTWCHRTMFAEWWEEQTGQLVADLDHLY